MRINGRTLRPSTLVERRFLLSLGVTEIRVPRTMNPFTAARRVRRAARSTTPDHDFARALARAQKRPDAVPVPSPDVDRPEPVVPEEVEFSHERAA
jgi:hypothetical protein